MTVAIYVYENATLVLPPAVVDFRQRFDQAALDVPQACPATDLVSSQVKIWGRLIGDKAHLLVSKGATLIMELPAIRQLRFAGITVQDGGVFDLQSYYGDPTDQWSIEVCVELVDHS
ncbi:hypothetical protein NP493_91g04021 [Ridgeia piscesae]|uniref:Uncharacterized protein n=1 Tax=Ridgeia piscesae TaxID=27915 RepID=A0AAD9UHU7_RIDPI|nr:hypothetical protein NP493_91g04021 [Ridgeia piscesae]